MKKKVINIKETVRSLLLKHHDCRDNDRQLMLRVWATQYPQLRGIEYRFRHFAALFQKGQLADPESIRRTRQKLQELHPELRGRHYANKKGPLEQQMRIEMPKMKT